MRTHDRLVWVVTFDPMPGVKETARVFECESDAYTFQDGLPSYVKSSLIQPAPYIPKLPH